ncbi:unnamed protein product [Arctogadus glacialis]
MMRNISLIVFGFLLGMALSAPVKVQEESETKFHGEDFHIQLPSVGADITFRPSSGPRQADTVLMRDGEVVGRRAKLNLHFSHLVLDNVSEGDEGVYTLKNAATPEDIRRIRLIVRDCSNEESVRYGDTYNIHLLGVTAPITLEYRPLAVEANQTSRPALVLMTSTGLSRDGYQGRIVVNERHVSLSSTTGADEGSYTIRDADGNIKRKVCLNVQEHFDYKELPNDGVMKINLRLDSSLVSLYYSPNNDSKPVLLMDKGELTPSLSELGMEGRLHMEGTTAVLDHLRASDAGRYEVVDALSFPVAVFHLELEPYRLPMVLVAVIALCGLLAFLLLVCLLSCLWKVKKRARRAAELEKIAENAGKEDEGDAFRQVVKNMKQLNDDSKHSQAENTEKSQSTEVDIKGLEVSSKEVGVDNMETSDSGVGFNTTALPLDTDTDIGEQILESEAEGVSVAMAPKPSPPAATAAAAAAAAVTTPSAPPSVDVQPPPPDTNSTPDYALNIPSFADVKLSPAQSPEPRAGLSPGSKPGERAKTPEPSPVPSPGLALKASSPMAPSARTAPPTPEAKPALTPTPEPSTAPESAPTVNGTPEPAPGSKASPEAAPKVVPPKTPEVELKADAPGVQAEETTT